MFDTNLEIILYFLLILEIILHIDNFVVYKISNLVTITTNYFFSSIFIIK